MKVSTKNPQKSALRKEIRFAVHRIESMITPQFRYRIRDQT